MLDTDYGRFTIAKKFVKQLEQSTFIRRSIDLKYNKLVDATFVLSAKFTEPFYLAQTLITILESTHTSPEHLILKKCQRSVETFKHTFDEEILSIRAKSGMDFDYHTATIAATTDEYKEIIAIKFGPWLVEMETDDLDLSQFNEGDRFFKEEGFEEND
jgi:hypothetical protein